MPRWSNGLLLDIYEEQALYNSLMDKDDRGFSLNLAVLEDMANLLLRSRGAPPVSHNWPQRFIQRHPALQMRFSRSYDFQRALCEDADAINAWFRLVVNMKAKYSILDCDFYNFDETGFMIGMIEPSMVITRAERKGRRKNVQPGN